jgi:uncharacterized membrane protein
VTYLLLKYVHIIGAAVLFGTGAGIAFFMLMAHRTGKPATIAAVARIVVIADFVFTASAVILQPVSGLALAWNVGYSLAEGWIVLSITLYIITGVFWLPVVWMQIRMREMARAAMAEGCSLPTAYHALFWTWFAFGFPAFGSIAGILWLMIARPDIVLFG